MRKSAYGREIDRQIAEVREAGFDAGFKDAADHQLHLSERDPAEWDQRTTVWQNAYGTGWRRAVRTVAS